MNDALTGAFGHLFKCGAHDCADRGSYSTESDRWLAEGTLMAGIDGTWNIKINDPPLKRVCPECYAGGYASAAILRRSYANALDSSNSLVERESATPTGSSLSCKRAHGKLFNRAHCVQMSSSIDYFPFGNERHVSCRFFFRSQAEQMR